MTRQSWNRTSQILAASMFAGLATCATSSVLAAVISADWTGGSGDWSDSTQWSFSQSPTARTFPDNDAANGETFAVDLGDGPVVVRSQTITLDTPVEIDSLSFSGARTLSIANGNTLVVNTAGNISGGTLHSEGAGTIRNLDTTRLLNTTLDGVTFVGANGSSTNLDGTIRIENGGALQLASKGSTTILNADLQFTLTGDGTGRVTLSDTSHQGQAKLTFDSPISAIVPVTNENVTIHGEGEIGHSKLEVFNGAAGTIDADVSGQSLVLVPSASMQNSGLLKASNGGILSIETAVQNAGGTIAALDGSTVRLAGVTIAGGTLTSTGSGIIQSQDGTTLDGIGMTIDGTGVAVNDGSTTALRGSFDFINGGHIDVATKAGLAEVVTDGTVALEGDGSGGIVLSEGVAGQARVSGADEGLLIVANARISGHGQLGADSLALDNKASGVIEADDIGKTLTLDPDSRGVSNSGIIRARNGGILTLHDGQITNTATGAIEAGAGSTVNLTQGAIIAGGTLLTEDAGRIRNLDTTLLVGTTLDGATFLAADGSTTNLNGTIRLENGGVLELVSTGSETILNAAPSFTLVGDGTGRVTLSDTSHQGGAKLTFDSPLDTFVTIANQNVTIHGEGEIGHEKVSFSNDTGGIIDADVSQQTLVLARSVSMQNSGLLRASNGGILSVETAVQNGGGTIAALDGSTVRLTGVTVAGGTLTSTGSGIIQSQDGTTLDGIGMTIDGTGVAVNDGSTTTLRGNFDFINGGHIDVAAKAGLAEVVAKGTVALDGDGSGGLVLSEGIAGEARVNGIDLGVLIVGDARVSGHGRLGTDSLALDNKLMGVIEAGDDGKALIVDPDDRGVSNSGRMRARNGGRLTLHDGVFTNVGKGLIEAGAGSTVDLSQATVVGGTLSGTGSFQTVGSATLDGAGMVLDGITYAAQNGTQTTLTGSFSFENGARMELQSNLLFTDIVLDGNVMLGGDGSGVLKLEEIVGFDRARIRGVGKTKLTNEAVAIEGAGQVGFDSLQIENQAGGLMHANVAQEFLVFDPDKAGMLNRGVLRASNAGTLFFDDGEFDNQGAIEVIGSGVANFGNFAKLANLTAGTLGGGVWKVLANQQGGTILIQSADQAVTTIGGGAEVVLGGAESGFTVLNADLDDTLTSNAGRFELRDGRDFDTAGDLANSGTVTVAGPGSRLDVAGAYSQSAGSTILDGGVLGTGDGAEFLGGLLQGNGTIEGNVAFGSDSIFGPGFSTGIVNFNGDTLFDGLIELELDTFSVDGDVPEVDIVNTASDPAATGFDQINVTGGGATFVDGLMIHVALTDDAALGFGDFFDVITADTLVADLSQIAFSLPNDFLVGVVSLFDPLGGMTRQALRLTFVGQSDQAIPEPPVLALLLPGLALLVVLRGRFSHRRSAPPGPGFRGRG